MTEYDASVWGAGVAIPAVTPIVKPAVIARPDVVIPASVADVLESLVQQSAIALNHTLDPIDRMNAAALMRHAMANLWQITGCSDASLFLLR